MNPTIGRIVIVTGPAFSPGKPAIIHTVHSETCVSVNVFGWDGVVPVGSVVFSEEPVEGSTTWSWPKRD